MLVYIVEMRLGGQKLPATEVKSKPPYRGLLTVDVQLGQRTSKVAEQIIVATLTHVRNREPLLPRLDHVRVPKIRDDSFVIIGFQTVTLQGPNTETYPQAWWCRLVHEAAGAEAKRKSLLPA